MIHNERTRTIEAAPEDVWAVLGRFMHIHEFSPAIASVDAMTEADSGVGAQRRCHFTDGTSVVEEVLSWEEGKGYRVKLSEFSLPLKEAVAELSVEPGADGGAVVKMAMDYTVKFGPLGWVMGQTMMKMMTGKIFNGVLEALDNYVQVNRTQKVA